MSRGLLTRRQYAAIRSKLAQRLRAAQFAGDRPSEPQGGRPGTGWERDQNVAATQREQAKERPGRWIFRFRKLRFGGATQPEGLLRRVGQAKPTADVRQRGGQWEVYEPATGFVRGRGRRMRRALRAALAGGLQ